jgi:hypothetical protein
VTDGNPKMSGMRVLIGFLIIAAVSSAIAPSSQEFSKTYGVSDLEHFMARPTIGLTVEYGSDHKACRILIEPPRQLFHPEQSLPLMSSDSVTDILEEIAPVKMRGMSISSSMDSMGCAESRRTQYQDLEIDRMRNDCVSPTPEHEVRATIEYRRDICRKPDN